MVSSIFGSASDYVHMGMALEQAHRAAKKGEVPIGAVVVDATGVCIASAYNQVEQQHSQAAHAELLALQQAGHGQKDWRLAGCWLYVTVEPCFMCMSLVYLSRTAGVVYGASSPLYGSQLDSSRMVSVYKVDAVRIISGVRAAEATDILKQFFKRKRNDDDLTQ
jgi:tRNA(Arg) A34 adenosine deaminase TadA